MQAVKNQFTKSTKLGLKDLIQYMTEGLKEWKSDTEAIEFGIKAMSMYDYQNDLELKQYMLGVPVFGKYYRNLIYKSDLFTMKNLYWYPKSITAIHGHAKSDWWVVWNQGELVERVFKVCKYFGILSWYLAHILLNFRIFMTFMFSWWKIKNLFKKNI